MSYVPASRGTLLIPSGTTHHPDKKHLFVVCNDAPPDGKFFLVTVATWRNHLCDETCILDPGSHEFIKVKSYVLFRKSRIERGSTLLRGVQSGMFTQLAPVDAAVLSAVCAGVLASDQTPRKLKQAFRSLQETPAT